MRSLQGADVLWLARHGGPHLCGGVDAFRVEPLLALVALHEVAGRLRVVRLLANAEELLGCGCVLLLNLALLLDGPLCPRFLQETPGYSEVGATPPVCLYTQLNV